jgi:PAS domain S-box-containing protein
MMAVTGGEIRVLHVDDEPDFADLAAEFLTRQDERISVETETNVRDALGQLGEIDVHCIVSDYDMPGQNGIEFLEAVREEYPDLPFILYTGKGSEEVAGEAISAGVTEYLQKETGTGHYELLFNRIENAIEQRRAEKIAAETEQRLQTLAENTNDILWMFNGDWSELLFINSPYETIWGRSMAELSERPPSFLDGVHPEDRGLVQEAMLALSDGESVDIEYRVNADEAFGRWVWVQGEPVFDDTGEVAQVVGFARDITDRKEEEQELIQQRADLRLYERIVENSTDLLAAVDTEYTILFGNDRYLEFHGLDQEDIDQTTLPEVLGEEWEAGVKAHIDRALAGEAVQYEMGREGADDEVRTFDLRNYPLTDEDGTVIGTVGAMRDVTERKEHESRLEHTNNQLEEFASIVSHDLQNPLSVASGRLELAREEYESEDLDAVARAHDRMRALIDELLELARTGAGETDVEPLSMPDVIDTRWWAEAEGVTIDVQVDRSIKADEGQLKQLLTNLIGNAIEHGGSDVTVTIGEHSAGFFVEDDGPGIPPDERDRIFDPGYTTKRDGTGFGLNIVSQVLTAHNWEIAVTGGRDGGARFEISNVQMG